LLRGVDAGSLSAADFVFAARPAGETFDGTAHWGGAIEGTAGIDTVSFAGAPHAIYVDLLRDGGYAEGLGPASSASVSSIENVTGSATMLNYLHGSQADNVLVGGDSFDWLVGRGGNNTLDGRGGINFADYYETDAPVSIDLTTGKATHSTGVDTLINIQQFRATNAADEFHGDGQDNYFLGMNGNDTVFGGAGNDTLDGSGNDDTLDGGAGDDVLIGSSGHDDLTGGADADRFVYGHAESGHDRILDFNAAEGDRIDFRGMPGVASFGDLGIGAGDGGALVTYGDDSSILLVNVAPEQVNASWFIH
jgi:Ca2+-binding RTX toxin-like protein